MNVGFQEIFLISIIALVVLGPERLPTAIRTVALWVNRFKRSFNEIKYAVEKEIDAEEIRRQIHNENVLHELGESRDQMQEFEQELLASLSADNSEKTNTESTAKGTVPEHTNQNSSPSAKATDNSLNDKPS